MSHLKLVKNDVFEEGPQFQLLVVGSRVTRVLAEERPVKVPFISLLLSRFYALDGFIEAGEPYKLQLAATLQVSFRGQRRTVRGAIVPLLAGPDLILPVGYFTSG